MRRWPGPLALLRRLARAARRRLRRQWLRLRLGGREAEFAIVYSEQEWGRSPQQQFCSGKGSQPENFAAYVEFVNHYIRDNGIRKVLDIGCGDYQVAARLDLGDAEYLGVDIVTELIDHNSRRYGSSRVRFAQLDAGVDPLPDADLCLIRQVLQHWSDEDIQRLLPRLAPYRHVLILDGAQVTEATPGQNTNIRTGGRFRRGGLYLEAAPFHADVEELLTYLSADGGERFRLVRYRRAA